MNAKTTIVKLSCVAIGVEQREFEVSHAERLLSIRNNGGWYLDDKEFKFDNGNIVRRHTEKAGEARKAGGKE